VAHAKICPDRSNVTSQCVAMVDKSERIAFIELDTMFRTQTLLQARDQIKKDCKLVYGADFYQKITKINRRFVQDTNQFLDKMKRANQKTFEEWSNDVYSEVPNIVSAAPGATTEPSEAWKQDMTYLTTIAKYSRTWLEECLLEIDQRTLTVLPPWFVYDRQWPCHIADATSIASYESAFDRFEKPSAAIPCNVKLSLQTTLDVKQAAWKKAFKLSVINKLVVGEVIDRDQPAFFMTLLETTYRNGLISSTSTRPSRKQQRDVALAATAFVFSLFAPKTTTLLNDGYTTLNCIEKLVRARVFPSLRHMDQYSLSWAITDDSALRFQSPLFRTTGPADPVKGYVTRYDPNDEKYMKFYRWFSFREIALELLLDERSPVSDEPKVYLGGNNFVFITKDELTNMKALLSSRYPATPEENQGMLEILARSSDSPAFKRTSGAGPLTAIVFFQCMRNTISFPYLFSHQLSQYYVQSSKKTLAEVLENVSSRKTPKRYGVAVVLIQTEHTAQVLPGTRPQLQLEAAAAVPVIQEEVKRRRTSKLPIAFAAPVPRSRPKE
jgi:hypothetical protein